MKDQPQLILSPFTLGELTDSLKAMVVEVITDQQQKQFNEKLVSPAEACKLFSPKISLPTLAAWEKLGYFSAQRIGGRVFYRQSEILQAGKTLRKYKS